MFGQVEEANNLVEFGLTQRIADNELLVSD